MSVSSFETIFDSGFAPQASVILPLYQQSDFLEESINSVLAQIQVSIEILISDDCSGDDTFHTAKCVVIKWLENNYNCPHVIRLRQGKTRLLPRNHRQYLSNCATCDIIIEMHGDDISFSTRVAIILGLFSRTPSASCIISRFVPFSNGGKLHECNPSKAKIIVDRVNTESCIKYNTVTVGRYLIGACLAWKRSFLLPFRPLNTKWLACAHDRLIAYRSSLTGMVLIPRTPLLFRRIHHGQAGIQMSYLDHVGDQTSCEVVWPLHRVLALKSMSEDLYLIWRKKYLSDEDYLPLKSLLAQQSSIALEDLSKAYAHNSSLGLRLACLTDDSVSRLRLEP